MVTAPWQSVWTTDSALPGRHSDPKLYPGDGLQGRWFHCVVGGYDLPALRPFAAVTSPYTSPARATAGFVVPDAAAPAFPPDAAGRRVALLAGWGPSVAFRAGLGAAVHPTAVVEYTVSAEMWAALIRGDVDAVYTDAVKADQLLSSGKGYRFVHESGGWARGFVYGCHPRYGDLASALDEGLRAFKGTAEYQQLCNEYPSVDCDCVASGCVVSAWSPWSECTRRCDGGTRKRTRSVAEAPDPAACPALEQAEACNAQDCSCAAFRNTKTPDQPGVAAHAAAQADIVVGTEADYAEHNFIRGGVLGGFDIELTRAVCAAINKTCAVVTVPWAAAFPSEYEALGWVSNDLVYPGRGFQNRWFHCVVGARNLIVRQQSVAFSHPYTDRTADKAGFVVLQDRASGFPADAADRSVAVVAGYSATTYFLSQAGVRFRPRDVVQYTVQTDMWAALTDRRVDAVYADQNTAAAVLSHSGFRLVHAASGYSGGVSYACHPEYGDVVAALNEGLAAFKATPQYTALCDRFPGIACDAAGATYDNVKTDAHPEIADHPLQRADIVFGTEGDWGQHNYIHNGVLGGFDVELTRAVCALMGKSCAVVTVPWQSIWTSNYSRFGWPTNSKNYPGEGHQSRWFHCSMGTFNTVARQQSIAFTHPYAAAVPAGFVVSDASAAAGFPADAAGQRVGVMEAWAATQYFETLVGTQFTPRAVLRFTAQREAWQALANGSLDAAFVDETAAKAWVALTGGFQLVHTAPGWTGAASYGCHPEYGDVVAALNAGLAAFKATPQYTALCDRFPGIACDTAGATYDNVKTDAHPEIADHPLQRADIVFGTEGDWGQHNYIHNGVLGGFDVELTRAVCALMGKSCAVVTVPWQSIWTSDYSRFGWPTNSKNYPGEGHQSRWFHCSMGTANTVARQQSIAFSHPCTDVASLRAGFCVAAAAAPTFPADAAATVVGVLRGWAAGMYFLAQVDVFQFVPADVVQFTSQRDLWEALLGGRIDAAYVAEQTAADWLPRYPAYRLIHTAAGWAHGVAYGCHPEYGDLLQALNGALAVFKTTAAYAALCARHPGVPCDAAGATYANAKTAAAPEAADHPLGRADLVIGTEAALGDHSNVHAGVLRGFDLELTQAVCALLGRRCAVVTFPGPAAWPIDYALFGWGANTKAYPGEGLQGGWFHCAVGVFNTGPWQQSVAFSDPYTGPGADTVGFLVPGAAATAFPADAAGKTVGLHGPLGALFHAAIGSGFSPARAVHYASPDALLAALTSGAVDAVFADTTTARPLLSHGLRYRMAHAAPRWVRGLSYACHPAHGGAVAALNRGLRAFKATPAYRALCARYPAVHCDCVGCQVTEWTDWGPCSVDCGSGSRSRARTVPANGTGACEYVQETQACRAPGCGDAAFLYLFDGCPRGGLAEHERLFSTFIPKSACEYACRIDPACTAIEVNGCLQGPDCQGQCWHFSGPGPDIHSAGCVTTGDQRAYLNPAALRRLFHHLFDGCPRGGLVSRRYGVAAAVSKEECMRDCLLDAACNAVEVSGCEAGGGGCACALFAGDARDVYDGGCGPAGGRAAYLKATARAECAPGRNPCAPNAACAVAAGGFNCTCLPGTAGDGFTCSTFSATATGTASGTPSTRATALATPTPSPSATPTAHATPTPTPTRSASPSATRTPLPTATPQLRLCVQGPAGPGLLQFGGGGRCVQSLSLGPGSETLWSRLVLLRLESLGSGTLGLQLSAGCRATAEGCPDCAACVRTFTPADVGRTAELPVAAVADVVVYVSYAPAAGARRLRSAPVAVSVHTVWQASGLFLGLLCAGLGALLLMLLCAGQRWYRRRRHRIVKWKRNPRLAAVQGQLMLGSSMWCIGAGLVCGLVVGVLRGLQRLYPPSLSPSVWAADLHRSARFSRIGQAQSTPPPLFPLPVS